ncbi:MAG TPA: hypothetical protein PK668_04680 [Myxococcota bacterium]|nr:hypothetical protein [Myxococcota bacterium]HRY92156.1 hypothetical protein [Myxococcota bacterium]HSA20652.1 hypothetical protein [Myxococcota bacterium]
MRLEERARAARNWADMLVQELGENLRDRWADHLAETLSRELQEELDEDLQEVMPPVQAARLADAMSDDLWEELHEELRRELPADVQRALHEELEALLFQELTRGRPRQSIRRMAVAREEQLAEEWARYLAGEVVHHLFERVVNRLGKDPRRP